MAVQARHFPHEFPAVAGSSLFLMDDYAGCAPTAWPRDTTALREFPRSDLACDGDGYGFVPRKRPRLMAAPTAGCFLDEQRAVMAPAAVEGLVAVPPMAGAGEQSRALGSAAASTSGRPISGASAARGVLAWMQSQGDDIDALVALEAERMRAGLEDARRRHAGALLAAACRAASARLRAAELDAERALRRNAELEEKARQVAAECQAWMGVARSHDAVAAGLRATLGQLLQPPCRAAAGAVGGEGDAAEDAQSCCFEEAQLGAGASDCGAASSSMKAAPGTACRSCGGGEACVLLLPCRHLCLCRACEPGVDACPVCAAAKNGSLHVLFS